MNWNLKEETSACIDSVLKAGMSRKQIIVVDNGSQDGSPQYLHARFGSALQILTSPVNLGFPGAGNLGFQHVMEQGGAWTLLLNNDTQVAPTLFVELARAIRHEPSVAIIGPLILYHGDPDKIWYLGDRLIPGLLATHSLSANRIDRGAVATVVPVDFVSGCCMLVKNEVFEAIGPFDTSLFMYGEDVDFCWRAREAGFRIVSAPKARIWHRVSASAGRHPQRSRYLRTRNQNLFYRKYSRGPQVPAMVIFSLLRTLRVGSGDLVCGRLGLLKPLIRGWIDGWIGRGD